jgi:hypothetical protein
MNAPDNVHPIALQNRLDLCGKRLGVSLEVYIGLQRHAFFPDQSRGRKHPLSLRGMDDQPAVGACLANSRCCSGVQPSMRARSGGVEWASRARDAPVESM